MSKNITEPKQTVPRPIRNSRLTSEVKSFVREEDSKIIAMITKLEADFKQSLVEQAKFNAQSTGFFTQHTTLQSAHEKLKNAFEYANQE